MKLRILTYIILLAFFSLRLFANTDEQILDKLKETFTKMYFKQSVYFEGKINVYKDNKEVSTADIRVFVQISSESKDISNKEKVLIIFDSPKYYKGRKILYETAKAWMYFPNTTEPIRIPLSEQLLGDADIASILNLVIPVYFNFKNKDLSGNILKSTWIEKKEANPPFGKVLFESDIEKLVPLRALYYTKNSEIVFREIQYLEPKIMDNIFYISKYKFSSPINNEGDFTTISYSVFKFYEAPKYYFNPNRLKDIK